jgi:hypothetical protein
MNLRYYLERVRVIEVTENNQLMFLFTEGRQLQQEPHFCRRHTNSYNIPALLTHS